MIIDNIFNLSDIVYLKTDSEQHPHIITAIFITINEVKYLVKKGSSDFYCFDFELSLTKDILISTTN